MLEAIGQWITRDARPSRSILSTLRVLHPFHGRPLHELERAGLQARWVKIEPGLIDTRLGDDQWLFLRRGHLQIQTASGFVLPLSADSPRARFPLPAPPDVVSLFAAEPCTLLAVTPEPGDPPSPPAEPVDIAGAGDSVARLRDSIERRHSELPSLPDLAIKIGRAIDDRENSNEDIARLIQLDPSLTARLLSIVNSAAFGGTKKISSIGKATTRLGRGRLRSLVYSCLVRSLFKINAHQLERRMAEVWQHSVSVAALSFVLARETPGIEPEQALLAGLIHDIGAVAVIGSINRFPEMLQDPPMLDFAIASLRREAGIRTLRQWDLQDGLESVIRDAGNWKRVGVAIPQTVDVVNLAMLHAAIGQPAQQQLPRIDSIPAFVKLARGRLTPRHSLTVLEAADADVREVRRLLAVR